MKNKNYIYLNNNKMDGKLYYNPVLNTVEALIPTSFGSNHAVDLLELSDGSILAAWFAGTREGNADISIVLARLDADADAWNMIGVISDDPRRSEQNPSLFLNPNGEIWLMYTSQVARETMPDVEFNLQYTSHIQRKISKDGGRTWGKTETMFDKEGSFSRQKIQILSSGRWIFGNWMCHDDSTHNGSDITVMQISDDGGKTWRSVEVPESRGCVHANILEIQAGRLIALFRSRAADNIYISRSEDNGDSWSMPVRTQLPNNNAGISAIKLKSGRIAIAYNPVRFNDDRNITVWPPVRCPVAVAVSEDEGQIWPWCRYVEMGDGFFGEKNISFNHRYEYPCMIQDKDGMVHVAYSFYSRICMKHIAFNEQWLYEANQDNEMYCK